MTSAFDAWHRSRTHSAEKDRLRAVLFAYKKSASDLVTFSLFSGKLEE